MVTSPLDQKVLPIRKSLSMFVDPRRAGVPPRWAAAATACAAGLSLVTGSAGAAYAAGPSPAVTRAALDPSLVAGRGAAVAFAEQEAEKAVTTGSIIGPDRTAYT